MMAGRVAKAAIPALLAGLWVIMGGGAAAQGLVDYVVEDLSIPTPLTDTPGNPSRGRQLVRDVNNVPCLICHAMPIPEEPDQGAIGPPLHGIGSRYSPAEIRLRLVDPKAVNPNSIMPSYYRVEGLNRVLARHRDQPIYTAQQIEDVVAYLASLRGN